MSWTARERFEATMAGEPADRSPVCAWRHTREQEHPGGDLAGWTVDTQRRERWDWVKINPRASYYGELWGNEYRTGDYESRDIPRQVTVAVHRSADLDRLRALPLETPVLAEQLRVVGDVRRRLPDVPVQQTVFSPLSTLIQLAGQSYYPDRQVFGAAGDCSVLGVLTADRPRAHRALAAIADTFARYVQRLREIGADGIFYAVTGTAHPALTSAEMFTEFSEPYDRTVLDAASGMLNIVHTCGPQSMPNRFTGLGAAVSWDQFAVGNPGLADLDDAVVVGGVDHRGFAASNEDTVREQAEAAAAVGRYRPVLVTPTCSVPTIAVAPSTLAALRDGATGSDAHGAVR